MIPNLAISSVMFSNDKRQDVSLGTPRTFILLDFVSFLFDDAGTKNSPFHAVCHVHIHKGTSRTQHLGAGAADWWRANAKIERATGIKATGLIRFRTDSAHSRDLLGQEAPSFTRDNADRHPLQQLEDASSPQTRRPKITGAWKQPQKTCSVKYS